MSVEAKCASEIKDRDALVETLEDIFPGCIQIVEGGIEVKGFRSSLKPEVLIKLKNMYGTAGYHKNKEGNYELVYDSTDRSKLAAVIIKKDKMGKVVKDGLAQAYMRNTVKKAVLGKLRGRFVKDQVDEQGRIKLKVKVSRF